MNIQEYDYGEDYDYGEEDYESYDPMEGLYDQRGFVMMDDGGRANKVQYINESLSPGLTLNLYHPL